MRDLLRETAVGHAIRVLGGKAGKRLLPYPEEVPGFVIPTIPSKSSTTSSQTATDTQSRPPSTLVGDEEAQLGDKLEKVVDAPAALPPTNVIVVGWYGEADPANPQNWSSAKKAVVMIPLCLLTFAVYVGSSIITAGFESLMQEFGVSEQAATATLSLYVIGYGLGALLISPLTEIPSLGRNPFYVAPMLAFVAFQAGAATVKTFAGLCILRLTTAILGGPVLAVGGATVADMYSPLTIPIMLAVWVVPAFSGPGLGPVFANPAAQANGWRWTMWELLWASGFTAIVLLFLLPETSHANILLKRAERLRKLTGDSSYKSESEVKRGDKSFGKVLSSALIKPFEITIKDPSVAFANIYVAIIYASYYLFFAAFPLVYLSEEQGGLGIYNFSFVAEGTAFVSIIVAGVLGFAIYVCYQHFYMRPWIAKNGWPVNEKRLELAIPASFFASVGLWIFAWSARKSAHWIGPLIGTGLFAASNFVTLQCLFFYIILSYQEYGASILAANDVLRAAAATGMLHAGSPFYKALGIDGGTSLLAGLALLGVGGMWVLYHYGARLRAKSRFAVGDGN